MRPDDELDLIRERYLDAYDRRAALGALALASHKPGRSALEIASEARAILSRQGVHPPEPEEGYRSGGWR